MTTLVNELESFHSVSDSSVRYKMFPWWSVLHCILYIHVSCGDTLPCKRLYTFKTFQISCRNFICFQYCYTDVPVNIFSPVTFEILDDLSSLWDTVRSLIIYLFQELMYLVLFYCQFVCVFQSHFILFQWLLCKALSFLSEGGKCVGNVYSLRNLSTE